MQLNPYLPFNGQCEAAFKFYQRCLGGKIEGMQTHGDSPMTDWVSPEWYDKILHVSLVLGEQVLMGSDVSPEHYEKPQGILVSLQLNDPNEAERVFAALAENGTVTMALEQTFWAERFGMLKDQFGIPWLVNCDSATTQEEL